MPVVRFTRHLHSTDVLFIAFNLLLAAVVVTYSGRIAAWRLIGLINVGAAGSVFVLAKLRHATGSPVLRLLHDWYIVPATFYLYRVLTMMIPSIHHGRDYDRLLIHIDRTIFGTDPTVWLAQYANPWITEILQIAYTSFYFLFAIVGIEFYRKRTIDVFRFMMFTCVYGFLLSYLGYFFLPAVGPRFTLHDFSALDRELPGVLLTPCLRWFVNIGAAIPTGVPNDIAIASTQRDVFPSGHTMMTLVLMYLCHRYRAGVRGFIYVIGSLLIVATVYERYHYVVDLIAGGLFFGFCVATSSGLHEFVKRTFGTIESRPPETLQ